MTWVKHLKENLGDEAADKLAGRTFHLGLELILPVLSDTLNKLNKPMVKT